VPKYIKMNNLHYPPTIKTPEITFKNNGTFSIKGNSYPENVNEFYKPVMNWLDDFLQAYDPPIELNVDLKYINTTSIKFLLNIIIKIRSSSKNNVKVKWQYEIEDDDMLATGEDLEKLSNLKFEFREK
jgi:hypothetical protein